MPQKPYLVMILCLLSVTGCERHEPVNISGAQQSFVGAWYYSNNVVTEHELEIKRMLLRIDADSGAAFYKCLVTIRRDQDSNARSSWRNSVFLPDAVVVAFADDAVTLQQEVDADFFGKYYFRYDVDIVGRPRNEGDGWHLGVEELVLIRLDGSSAELERQWECPEYELDPMDSETPS